TSTLTMSTTVGSYLPWPQFVVSSGETVLHMGIVSEDPEIVRFLLKCGADVNARWGGTCKRGDKLSRCTGNFFTCDDQKSSRTDSVTEEHALLSRRTTYNG